MRHVIQRLAVSLTVAGALAAAVTAQERRSLSVDTIYDPVGRADFSGAPPPSVTWLDDSRYLTSRRGARGAEWVAVDAATGRSTPLLDAERMENALSNAAAVSRDEARQVVRSADLTFNPARSAVLVTLAGDLYLYDIGPSAAVRLTRTPGDEEEATFSPDGRHVAFVRSNNLHVVELASARERALTTDGGPQLLNGKLDWLYQEEIYGRGNWRAFWWSPDSSRLAFLQLDERPVPEYTVVDHIPYRPGLEVTDYPKAGDPNPLVKLGVADLAGTLRWVDLGDYADTDILVVNVGWTPDSRFVVHQVQDREQTWLDLNLAGVPTGERRRLLRETTPAWVSELGNPVWLGDGSFLWFSERSGFKHLYHVGPDGQVRRQITNGRWDVRTLYGVDEKAGAIFFASGARDHLDTDIFRIALNGDGMTRISRTPGTHRATFSPGFTHYVDVWSDAATPPQARLHRADGAELRVIEANPVSALRDYQLATPEFVQVTARDGFVMDAMMLKPPDFDPSKRYPVYQFTYAGPGTAQVRNQWGGTQYMFHQALAQHGVIVWVLDNRSAGGKGVEAQWPIYGRLGERELQDLEDGVEWLERQPFVDASRILLSGWSYGGFMAAYALTHSTSWAAGIVGAPVTDWRDYDTIYTERYMKLPQHNADGYRRTAPRFAADRLHGRLLLLHGMMDDNVHLQNTVQFAYELQRAGKPFEMMLYPRSRHGITDARLNLHLRRLMFDFVMRTVRPD
jgi:dipeptidyl-peptidase-4